MDPDPGVVTDLSYFRPTHDNFGLPSFLGTPKF